MMVIVQSHRTQNMILRYYPNVSAILWRHTKSCLLCFFNNPYTVADLGGVLRVPEPPFRVYAVLAGTTLIHAPVRALLNMRFAFLTSFPGHYYYLGPGANSARAGSARKQLRKRSPMRVYMYIYITVN